MTSPATPSFPQPLDCTHYARDAWPLAAKWTEDELSTYTPVEVKRPKSIEALRADLAEARARRIKVVPYGAGSGVCGAISSPHAAIVIDTRELNQMVHFDPQAMTVTVGAGMMGGELEQWLNARGYTCGHYPQSLPISTVGGWLATRGIGTFSNHYGGIEALVYSVEVMLADGTLLSLGRAPRSAAGPRLLELFLGSEGTLGIITQVTLKIFTLPQKQLFAAYRCTSLEAGLESVRQMFACHCPPALVRLYDEAESVHLYQAAGEAAAGSLLILAHAGHADVVAAQARVTDGLATAQGAQPLGEALGEQWNRGRYHAAWLEANRQPQVIADSIEVSAPWPAIMPLYHEVMQAIAPHVTTRMGHMSHFYSTGTMIYFIFTIEDADLQALRTRYHTVWDIVTQTALRHHGTCTHHHGVGLARRAALGQELGETAAALLRGIKAVLDPEHLLNPDKLVFAGTD